MKRYAKPRVTEGWWLEKVAVQNDGKIIAVCEQYIDGDYQDHYAIYIDGKRQRKTEFGESAHMNIARRFNDMVHWTQAIFGDQL